MHRIQIHLKKDRLLIFFFVFLAILLFTLLACLWGLKVIASRFMQSAEERYDSFQIADELRQSSDDLTKMVRLYVVTGDKKYRDYYDQILDIRNGKCPRPINYHEIFLGFS